MGSLKNDEIPLKGLEQFVPQFHLTRERELVAIRESLNKRDFAAIEKIAHRWKGFCTPYGYHKLELLSRRLEYAAKTRDITSLLLLIHEIDEYLVIKGRKSVA